MRDTAAPLTWLEPGQDFPDPPLAWGPTTPAPGLLAAGGALDTASLLRAYRKGIFPWYGPQDPPLWWSPDPRMVLRPPQFRLHRSLRQRLRQFVRDKRCEVRVDHAFEQVIRACAGTPRPGQNGTWIVAEMVAAYTELHRQGWAHSVETWVGGELVGGLYLVAIGHAVFGESMFSHATDASKVALSALVAICLRHGVPLIDCQQNTRHLASLGAAEMPRAQFLQALAQAREQPPVAWHFEPIYWTDHHFV